jgi:hypothetical protein
VAIAAVICQIAWMLWFHCLTHWAGSWRRASGSLSCSPSSAERACWPTGATRLLNRPRQSNSRLMDVSTRTGQPLQSPRRHLYNSIPPKGGKIA